MDAIGRLKRLNNKGVAVVLLALMMVALVAFVGLAVDIGYMYVAKGQLQNAADAGALAGVSKLKYGVPVYQQYSTRSYSKIFAEKNNAAGEAVKVDLNTSNSINGDIVIGYWNGSTFSDTVPSGQTANAVKVVARRTSETGTGISVSNKMVPIFFGRVINWNEMGAKSEAIAALSPAPVVPMAVNEYWLESDPGPPYGNDKRYPNSFVRKTNVNGTTSKVFGLPFGVLGSWANINHGSKDMSGYVNLDFRSSEHTGTSGSWYLLNTASTLPMDCANSCSWFSAPGAYDPTYGDVNSVKWGTSFEYLTDITNGYPYLLPIAVKEQYAAGYPGSISPNYPSPTSSCPFATVTFFSTSGTVMSKQNSKGQKVPDVYTVGTKFITLVYDGTYNTDPSKPNSVTIVGYTLLQVDGYANSNPNGLGKTQGKNPFFGDSGSTMYAHALEDIIEPASIGIGTCDISLYQKIWELRYRGGNVKLVH
jgi:Flp pilus assembly protein TadG